VRPVAGSGWGGRHARQGGRQAPAGKGPTRAGTVAGRGRASE